MFIEKHVLNGLENLRLLGTQGCKSTGTWNDDDGSTGKPSFFAVGQKCYYGEYPLSFAAACGASTSRPLSSAIFSHPLHFPLLCRAICVEP